jgi:hypothetical protein
MDVSVEKENSIIIADRHVTVRELSLQLDIGEASMCRRVKQCGYKEVCHRWVPQHQDMQCSAKPLDLNFLYILMTESSNFWLAS